MQFQASPSKCAQAFISVKSDVNYILNYYASPFAALGLWYPISDKRESYIPFMPMIPAYSWAALIAQRQLSTTVLI